MIIFLRTLSHTEIELHRSGSITEPSRSGAVANCARATNKDVIRTSKRHRDLKGPDKDLKGHENLIRTSKDLKTSWRPQRIRKPDNDLKGPENLIRT